MKIYQVGGCVRDKLLGKASKDIDWVVVGASPQKMLEQGYQQVGKDFPVFLHPHTHEEYALARTERKTGKGYTGFQVHASPDVSLEEDLRRRDLTINAIAEDESGQLIDPFNGQADLHAGILRHVSDAFVEDPVRVLRVARFAARYNFTLAEETLQLMHTMVDNGEVDALVAERVWQEMVKALGEVYPHRFFDVLRSCGALARIFPEINNLFGVPQPAVYHPEIDVGAHTLLCLQQARRLTEDTQVIFAVLTHDFGKATTPEEILPGHAGHEMRSVDLISPFCKRICAPRHYKSLALAVARYHTHCHRIQELRTTTILDALQGLDAFRQPQRFEQFLLACESDARGRQGLENTTYPQANLFRDIFAKVQQVDVKAIITEGWQGVEIAEKLRERRLKVIRQWKSESKNSLTE